MHLEVKPSKLSAYTETAISHVSSTGFFVLYFVSSFEMAPFVAYEMIVRGGACVCVSLYVCSLCVFSVLYSCTEGQTPPPNSPPIF